MQRAKALGPMREIHKLPREPAEASGGSTRSWHALVHKLAETNRRIAEPEMATCVTNSSGTSRRRDECGSLGDCSCRGCLDMTC